MTFPEYLYRMKAYSLANVDKQQDMHLQAWLNDKAGAKELKGKKEVPVFKEFKDFFDYDKAISLIEKPAVNKVSDQHKRMAYAAAKLNGNT